MKTSALIINGYDIRQIVYDIRQKYPGIEDSIEYERLEDLYIEYTQSCDKEEQINWMKHYISKGLDKLRRASEMYMPEQRNSRAELKYEGSLDILVAYDLMR